MINGKAVGPASWAASRDSRRVRPAERGGTMAKAKGGGANKVSSKTQASRMKKTVEDKTFGLKNKNKSKKVQRYVQQVQAQAQQSSMQVRWRGAVNDFFIKYAVSERLWWKRVGFGLML